MKAKVTMVPGWEQKIVNDMNQGLLEMTTDIHTRSTILAPKDSRALVNSGRIDRISDGYKIIYGSGRVPYARRRHFENKKNPQTLLYLEKAGESVARGDKSKYFRGKI